MKKLVVALLTLLLTCGAYAQSIDYTNPPLQFSNDDNSQSCFPYKLTFSSGLTANANHTASLSVLSVASASSLYATVSALNDRVPYTGATGSVVLGNYNISASTATATVLNVTSTAIPSYFLGKVSIGTSDSYAASKKLVVSAADTSTTALTIGTSTSAARYPGYEVQSYDSTGVAAGDGVGHPLCLLRSARGTEAVPTTMLGGDACGGWVFQAHDGTTWRQINRIISYADSDFDSTHYTGILKFVAGAGTDNTLERMRISKEGVIFNEFGLSTTDVRMEGDTETNLFLLDASADKIGMGTSSPQRLLHLFKETTSNTGLLTVEVINSDNSSGPTNNFWRARGTSAAKLVPSDGDIIGAFNFDAWDTSDYYSVAQFRAQADGTISLGSTPGKLFFGTTPTGSKLSSERMMIYSDGNIVINEGGVSTADVRIEGDTNSNLFFADASADMICIGASNPAATFDCRGEVHSSNDVTASGSIISANTATCSTLFVDSSVLFVNPNSNRVGINTTDPQFALHLNTGTVPTAAMISGTSGMVSSADGLAMVAAMTSSNTANIRGIFKAIRSRGTQAVPLAVVAEDTIMSFLGSAYDGSAVQIPATIDMFVDGTVSSGAVPARIGFVTGTNATDRKERLTIKNNGSIGVNDTTPSATFDANGEVHSQYDVTASGSVISAKTATAAVLDISGQAKIGSYILPQYSGSTGQVLTINSGGFTEWRNAAFGAGDVTATANLTDNAIVRGDGGAKGVQTSGVTISDANDVSWTATGTTTNSLAVRNDSLTTGNLVNLYSDSSSGSVRKLLSITNDNVLASGTYPLWIDDDGDSEYTIYVDSEKTTGNVLHIDGTALTTGSLGYFYSNSSSNSNRNLLWLINDNTAATGTKCLLIRNDSGNRTVDASCTGEGTVYVSTAGTLTYPANAFYGDSLTTGQLISISSDSASASARNLVTITNDHADADSAVCLKFKQDGAGNIIEDTVTNAKLTAAGVWTDATSMFDDKVNLQAFTPSGYIEKLKKLQLYTFQKKREYYGGKVDVLSETPIELPDEEKDKPDGTKVRKDDKEYVVKDKKGYEVVGTKYPDTPENPDSRIHVGYVLDDPNTPDELIAKDRFGNIDGISPTQNISFLMGVMKELIAKVETLEQETVVLKDEVKKLKEK